MKQRVSATTSSFMNNPESKREFAADLGMLDYCLEALDSKEWVDRCAACQKLGQLRFPASRAALTAVATNDARAEVRRVALAALINLPLTLAVAAAEAAGLIRTIVVSPGVSARLQYLKTIVDVQWPQAGAIRVGVSLAPGAPEKFNWSGVPVIIEPAGDLNWCEFLFLDSNGVGELPDLPPGEYRLVMSWLEVAPVLEGHLAEVAGFEDTLSALKSSEFEVSGSLLRVEVDWSRGSENPVMVEQTATDDAVSAGRTAGSIEVWSAAAAGPTTVLMVPTRSGGTWRSAVPDTTRAIYTGPTIATRMQRVTNGSYKVLILRLKSNAPPDF
jgi:hypothetical protein